MTKLIGAQQLLSTLKGSGSGDDDVVLIVASLTDSDDGTRLVAVSSIKKQWSSYKKYIKRVFHSNYLQEAVCKGYISKINYGNYELTADGLERLKSLVSSHNRNDNPRSLSLTDSCKKIRDKLNSHQFKKIHNLDYLMNEMVACVEHEAYLSTTVLVGSVIEGLLVNAAIKNDPKKNFFKADSAPKDNGRVKDITKWKLAELINVAEEVGIISQNVSKFSHAVRDFRNYIHPAKIFQMEFIPDRTTAIISLEIVNEIVDNLISGNLIQQEKS